jgi:hypothetical protein
MKWKIIISIITLLSVLFTGCKKDLELKQKGIYTTGNFFRNEADAIAAVAGQYSLLEQEDYIAHQETTFDVPSDDYWRSGDHQEDEGIENLTYDASNYQVGVSWGWKYETVNRANNYIVNIPKITDITPAIKTRSIGESYFFRAFGYWRLMVIYGDVPIITEDNYIKKTFNVPKSPIEQVRKQIESDLLKAISMLPESYGPADVPAKSKYLA